MEKGKILWTVKEVVAEKVGNTDLVAILNGEVKPPYAGSLSGIHQKLQEQLNGVTVYNNTAPSRLDSYAYSISALGLPHRLYNDLRPTIKKVIFSNPATIVIWSDNTKTVVKAVNEEFDPEKGLAMAIAKKAFGNQGNYFNEISRWTGEYANNTKRTASANYANTSIEDSDARDKCGAKLDCKRKPFSDKMRDAITSAGRTSTDISEAYKVLSEVFTRSRVTKAQLTGAIEEALGYLGHALDD